MRVLLFLSLLGFACCLQPSMKYSYKYVGSTETGIPEISSQGSGAAVKADIVIEVPEQDNIIVTLSNVEFAQLNGDLGMYSTPTGTYKFSPLQDSALSKIIQSPFTANILENADFAIHTQSEDPMWINNLRKAIVSSFRNQVVMSNFHVPHSASLPLLQNGKFPRSFEVLEESTFGLCRMQYTAHPLPDFIAGRLLPQRHAEPRSELSQSHGELLQVTRTVDFDSCQQMVSLKRSSPQLRPSQQQFQKQSLTGRSSVGEFIVSGTKGSFTIEQANIQGQIAAQVLGMTDEHIQSNTNQTLQLVAVERLSTPTKVNHQNAKPIRSWMQEVISPQNQPKISPSLPFVIYSGKQRFQDAIATLTGIQVSQPEEEQRQKAVIESLSNAAQQLSSQASSSQEQSKQVINEIKRAAEIMEGMSKSSLKQLVDQISQGSQKSKVQAIQRKLLIDAISSSGSPAAVELLIELTKQGQLSDIEAMTVTITILQNLQDPSAIPQLIKFATELDLKSRPFLAATALFNVAHVANHFCVNQTSHSANYASQLSGDQVCDAQLVDTKLVQHLKTLIHDESLTYERIVAIYALNRLSTSKSLEILAPVALGQKGRSSLLRSLSIYAIRRMEQPEESRQVALDLLAQIYSNIAEEPRVRMAALVTASSWSPGAVFWNKIARASWKEPSMIMVSIYQSLIQSYASTRHPLFAIDNKAAAQALRITRPVLGHKYMAAQSQVRQSIDQQVFSYQETVIGAQDSLVKNTNFDVYKLIVNSVNGRDFTTLEMDVMGGVFGKLKDTPHTDYDTSSPFAKRANEIFQQIQSAIEFSPMKQFAQSDKMVDLYVKILDNMQLLLPLTKETIAHLPFQEIKSFDAMKQQLQKGIDLMVGQFASPVTHKEFYPNELGLPVVVTQSLDVVMASSMKLSGTIQSQENSIIPRKAQASVEQQLRAISQTTGKIQVLVPWTNAKISTSVESIRDVIVPVKASLDFDIARSVSGTSQLQISLKPATSQKFNLISASNRPTASIEQMSLSGPRQQQQSLDIQRAQSTQQQIQIPKSLTGLDLSVQWDSQIRYPFDIFGMQTLMRESLSPQTSRKMLSLVSSPTAQKWKLNVQFDPSSSDTQSIVLQSKCQQSVVSAEAKMMDKSPTKSTQQQRPGQESSQQQRDSVFQQGLTGQTCSTDLKLSGRQERTYSLVHSRTQPQFDGQKQTIKTHIAFKRSALPGYDSKPMSVCLESSQVSPIVSLLDTVQTLQSRDMKSQITASIIPGCESQSPSVTAEIEMQMSKQQIEQVRVQAKQLQQIQPSVSLQSVLSQAVFDDIQSRIQWKKVCQQQGSYVNQALSMFNAVFMRGVWKIDCSPSQDRMDLKINLKRNSATNLWQLIASDESNRLEVSDIRVQQRWERIVSPEIIPTPQVHSSILQHQPQAAQMDTCFVQPQQVQTFAGSRYSYNASDCYAVAVTDCLQEAYAVLVRSSSSGRQSQDVKILDRKNGVVVEIINNAVKVNDQIIDVSQFRKQIASTSGQVLAEVFKQNGHVMVMIPEFVVVAVKDQVEIVSHHDQQVCGACGNANGERQFDLAGPKKCLYPEGSLFAASWTSAVEKCDESTLKRQRQEVKAFQQSCHKVHDVEGQMPYDKFPFTYDYPVHQQGSLLCVSVSPQPSCKSPLRPAAQSNVQVSLNCWDQNRAPQALKSAKGSIQQAIVEQPLVTIQQQMALPIRCA